jgi:nicotinate-nucleotide pyrophosphorylase (carboxylating)
MLDNMNPDDAAKCVEIVRSGARPHTLVEISGGVSLETVAFYATIGADLLSTSMITQSAPALDIGLDLGAE